MKMNKKSYQNLPVEYSDKAVTSWGGMRLMKEIIDRSGFREKLRALNLPKKNSNCGYDALTVIESFFVCVWCGGNRFAHTALVRFDEVIKQIFFWKRVPSNTTFGRFFKKFSWARNNEVFPQLQQWFFSQIKFDNYTLDVDSSVLTRYGEQEGSKVGYNPHKRGRASHHPIMAFIADLRMVANAWLRSGNTVSSTSFKNFLEETLEILREKTIGLLRGDSGFFSGEIFDLLEEKQIHYVIAGRMNPLIKLKILDIKLWNNVDRGISIAEFNYAAQKWSRERRFIVVRQDVQERPKASGKKIKNLKLFDDSEYYANYRYHIFVTDQTLPALQIWEQYKGRADAENRIQELKYDFGMQGFVTKDFFATEAAFRFVMVAYNLMSLFRQVVFETRVHQRLTTLRYNCFAIGSWVVKKGRQKILKMSVAVKKRQWMDGLFKNATSFSMPLSLRT